MKRSFLIKIELMMQNACMQEKKYMQCNKILQEVPQGGVLKNG